MLTAEQRKFYEDNGYLFVPGVLDRDEALALRDEAHTLMDGLSAQSDVEATWGSARELAGTETQLLHRHNVEYFSAPFHRVFTDERFTTIVSELMGSPNVELHHSKLFIKPPEKGSPFPLHQDHPFFPHERHSMMAAIIHLDDAPLEKGCLMVVPGSHQNGPIPHQQAGGWHLPFDQYPLESAVACPAQAGDVLFFSYLTIHGSGVNASQEARTTVLLQMRDPADKPIGDSWESGQGLMLRGMATRDIPTRVSV